MSPKTAAVANSLPDPLADPRGIGHTCLVPPPGPISFILTQFLAKILSNNRFLPQTQGLPPGKSWIRHCGPIEILVLILKQT